MVIKTQSQLAEVVHQGPERIDSVVWHLIEFQGLQKLSLGSEKCSLPDTILAV